MMLNISVTNPVYLSLCFLMRFKATVGDRTASVSTSLYTSSYVNSSANAKSVK